MTVEEKLTEMDFSKFSKVKESLLEKILKNYDAELMTDHELDEVAAAGNPAAIKKYPPKN